MIYFRMKSLVVAPLVGAWIEIENLLPDIPKRITVAPLVGAWIEIQSNKKDSQEL